MHSIYRCSVFTITALGGRSSAGGIPGSWIQPPRNVIQNTERFRQLSRDFFRAVEDLTAAVEKSVWSHRAWTFQEGILSPRKVVLTENQAHFVCEESYISESMVSLERAPSKDDGFPRHDHLNGAILSFQQWSFGKVYAVPVNRHSTLKLSFYADRSNVFRGLATYFCRKYGISFLYGLPSDFAIALLWEETSDSSANASPQSPSGYYETTWPTWSWFDYNGEVSYQDSYTHRLRSKARVTPLDIEFSISISNDPSDKYPPLREFSGVYLDLDDVQLGRTLCFTAQALEIELADWSLTHRKYVRRYRQTPKKLGDWGPAFTLRLMTKYLHWSKIELVHVH